MEKTSVKDYLKFKIVEEVLPVIPQYLEATVVHV